MQALNKHAQQLPQQACAELAAREGEKLGVKHGLGPQARSESNSSAEAKRQVKHILGTCLQPSRGEPPQQRKQQHLPKNLRYENNLVSFARVGKLSFYHLSGSKTCQVTYVN